VTTTGGGHPRPHDGTQRAEPRTGPPPGHDPTDDPVGFPVAVVANWRASYVPRGPATLHLEVRLRPGVNHEAVLKRVRATLDGLNRESGAALDRLLAVLADPASAEEDP
jgi:hypothetical protein